MPEREEQENLSYLALKYLLTFNSEGISVIHFINRPFLFVTALLGGRSESIEIVVEVKI